jgi:hypothetical protein
MSGPAHTRGLSCSRYAHSFSSSDSLPSSSPTTCLTACRHPIPLASPPPAHLTLRAAGDDPVEPLRSRRRRPCTAPSLASGPSRLAAPLLEPCPYRPSLHFRVDLGALRAAIRPIRNAAACGRVARRWILVGTCRSCEQARTWCSDP